MGMGLNIVVLVKYVPDSQSELRFLEQSPAVDRSDGILSELDEYAVEAALRLIEARREKSDRITVVTMGPAGAAGALKKALQLGAHEAVLVSDDAFVESDASSTSKVLAAAITAVGGADIVLTGMASTDGGTSLVPAQVAERLALPQITFASALELSPDGAVLMGQRDDDTVSEFIEVALPAVISVTDKINEPRYPSFRGIMAAKRKPVRTFALADLGLEASEVGISGATTVVDEISARPARERGVIVTDQGNAGVALVDFLNRQNIL